MKNIFKFLVFAVLVTLTAISCSKKEVAVYVSVIGNDDSAGTIEAPVATLNGAKNAIIKQILENKTKSESFVVYMREGIYKLNSTFELTANDSALVNKKITFCNYNNENVRVIGGERISGSLFKPVTDEAVLARFVDSVKNKIVVLNLKEQGITEYGQIKQHGFSITFQTAPLEIFIDAEAMRLSRWPNKGKVFIPRVIEKGSNPYERDFSNKGAIFTFDYDRASRWKDVSNIWMYGVFSEGFCDNNLQIESIDLNKKTIKTVQPDMFTVGATDTTSEWGAKIRGYFVYNVLEEIDLPGEYFVDKATGMLYLYPTKAIDSAEIMLSTLEQPMVAIENMKNIKFKGITFEVSRGMAFFIEGCENVTVEDATIRNVGTLAAMFGKGVESPDYPIHEFTGELKSRVIGNLKAHIYENSQFNNNAGTNNGFLGCKIYNTGTGAIVLSGGDRKTLTPAGNYVKNTELYNFNRWNKTYCPAIAMVGVGNIISHCYIHKAPHQAISINGNEHLVEYSHIDSVCLDVLDNGAIYLGRNPSERGNKIKNNYFSNVGNVKYKSCALHLDDGTSGTLVENNVFYRTSHVDFGDILLNGGSDNTIVNNIFIEGAFVLWIENQLANNHDRVNKKGVSKDGLWGDRMLRQIDITSDVWKMKYPGIEKFFEGETPMLKNLVFANNVVVKSPLIVSKNNITPKDFKTWENNYITETDPGFVDYASQNFELQSSSEVFKKSGFKAIDFKSIGLVK